MTSQKSYSYKKSLRLTAYAASAIVAVAVLSRIIAIIKNNSGFWVIVVLLLLLIVPLSAIVTVSTEYVVTSETVGKTSPLGRKSIRWMDVTEVVQKEGFFQQVLIVVDRNGKTLTVPFEQIDRGKELYATVREMVPKDRP